MTRKDVLLLMLAIGIAMGYTYCLDTPQALEIPLRQYPYSLTTTQFNMIYFCTFLFIGFLVIPLGVIIDRYPVKRTLIILLFALLLSQIVISIMFQLRPQKYLIVVFAMRSIFGLSGEGLFTIQCLIMSVFAGKQYQFLAGLALAVPFVFDAINSGTTTAVYDATHNLPLTWYIGCFVCLVSLFAGLWMNRSIIGQQNQSRNQSLEGNKSCFKQIKVLGSKFWVITFFIFFTEASLGPFNDNLNQLFVRRFNFSYTNSGKLLLIPFTLLVLLTLLCGYLLKKWPRFRRKSMLLSTSFYMLNHFILYFVPNTKEPQFYHYLISVGFLISMSLGFAVYYASITTAVPFLVNSSVIGTAFGFAGSAIGFSQTLVPLLFIAVIGQRTELGQAYRDLNGVGVILSIVPVFFAMWVNYHDYDILDQRYCQSEQHSTKYTQKQNQKYSLQQTLVTNDSIEVDASR